MNLDAQISDLGFVVDRLTIDRYDMSLKVKKAQRQHKKSSHMQDNLYMMTADQLMAEAALEDLQAERRRQETDKDTLAAAGMDDEQSLLVKLWNWCRGLV